jgi:predicted MFS family arabinose efflux permease
MGLNPYGEGVEEINSNKFVVEDKKAPFFLVIRTREFWFLILPFFICGFTTSGLMDTHLIPFCHDMGYTDQVTGTAVGLLAAFNILGTVLSGKMADRWSNRLMLAHLYFIRAVSILILLYTNQPTWLLLFSIIFGFVDFATVAPTQLLTTHYFKNYSVGLILGWIYLAHQIGSSLGSYIPGLLYNWYGSYKISFFSSIALLFFASILSLLLPEPKSTNKKIHLQEEMGT